MGRKFGARTRKIGARTRKFGTRTRKIGARARPNPIKQEVWAFKTRTRNNNNGKMGKNQVLKAVKTDGREPNENALLGTFLADWPPRTKIGDISDPFCPDP